MKRKTATKQKTKGSPETVSVTESLKRMKAFGERKENFIAAVKKSKD